MGYVLQIPECGDESVKHEGAEKKDLGKMELVWGSLFALTGSTAQDDEIVYT
jgi:hypothetical protein